ncbi:hypothetical protein [Lysinibacter sp. HNR]|uniref:hypothetical protein n=1 Tax=Lysinibacter sp. HNR TaxID=3031408 RepID=UPI0024352C14|nr:hypothetical protein [Lysinibacter sp. HNR]WGD38474.1 hypothetical protein FrondiHNR_06075 [Lysinibacter sp. HNR]
MATKTTPPVYDFDSWTEEAEAKAIAGLAPDIKYIIVEKNFIGRFVDGTIIELPLNVSLDTINELSETSDSPVDQIKLLLTKIGGAKAAAEFTRQNLAEAMALAVKFFDVFTRISQASLPE